MHEQEPFVDESRRGAVNDRSTRLERNERSYQRENDPNDNETPVLESHRDDERYEPHADQCEELLRDKKPIKIPYTTPLLTIGYELGMT